MFPICAASMLLTGQPNIINFYFDLVLLHVPFITQTLLNSMDDSRGPEVENLQKY